MASKRGHISLPEVGILKSLNRMELAKLSEFGHSLRVSAGTEVVKQETRQDSLYVVIDGLLAVSLATGDEETQVSEIRKGEAFGEMAIIDPARASANVRTLSDSMLWRIRKANLDDFILRNPDAGLRLLWSISGLLVKRLRSVNDEVSAAPEKKRKSWW